MNPDEQKDRVLEVLARRERIAAETKRQLEERHTPGGVDPLAGIDPAVRRAAEDEFYASQGRHRYETSDGRTLFLTPEEIALRRRARGQRGRRKGRGRAYDALTSGSRRRWTTLGFYGGAVLLALLLVWLILR